MKIVAVTACPSGVAHTYMSAEALQKAAARKGIELKVETQGSIGVENRITETDVAEADAVILTNDMPINDEARFAGKPLLRVGVSVAIKKADQIMESLETQLSKS